MQQPTPPPRQQFDSNFNLPVAIPVWGVLVALCSALFTAGTLYTKMDNLIETSKRSEDRVAIIAEKQVRGLAALEVIENRSRDHDQRLSAGEQRISALERATFRK